MSSAGKKDTDDQQRPDRALIHTADRGNVARVRRLLDAGANIDAAAGFGLTVWVMPDAPT